MKVQERIVLILFLALLPLGMRAQESEPKSPVDRPIESPVTLNGQGPSLAFQSEKIRSNYLSGGIALAGSFTDNALWSSTDRVSDFSYLVQPYLNFAYSAPRVDWNVSLGSAFTVHQRVSQENWAAEDLKLDLSYRLSPYITTRVSSILDNTTGLFSALNPATSGSGIGVVEQANNSLLIPFTQRVIGTSNLAELKYQFGPRSIVGARGAYSMREYPGSSQNSQIGFLFNSRTYSGEAFYNYQISAKQWVGVTLRTQKFDTQPFPAGTKTDSCLLFYALNVTPNVTLSFFAGPERFGVPRISGVATTVRLIRDQRWTAAEGATFTWQGGHTSVLAEFSRQLSDSGGLSSAVTAQIANAQLRHQLGSRRELRFGFTYARNDPLESGQSVRGLFGLFQFQQRLAKRLIAGIGYTREQQERLSGLGTARANLLWVSLSYDFSRPLGE